MKLKVVQLNLYKGKWLDKAVDFLKAENPDIITLQEVSAGEINFYKDKVKNLADVLKERLGLYGAFHSDINISDAPGAFFGNAVFSKFKILKTEVVQLASLKSLTLHEFNSNVNDIWSSFPRHMLDATLDLDGSLIHAISLHGRRTPRPQDSEESTRQSEVIVNHLRSLDDVPFIVGGDFNMTPDTKVVKNVETVANNLLAGKNIKQTLNPRLHFLKDMGFVVDYIFASSHFNVLSIDVPQVDVSDHLPVVAELEWST